MSDTWPELVVATARKYLGVRWHHQGRSRAGVDCAGLVVCVAHDLGLSEFDTSDYGRLPNGDTMRSLLREHCTELRADALAPGLVALMRFDGEPQHMGIVADYVHGGHSIVHALAQRRCVVEHRLDELWRRRIVALYALPGVEYAR
ncbi:MAG TPA: NlpC/P60 family protein [Burkholderiaceae bacterium]|nr:NlpC/P60 family protein [Burkholderiaceae bacterium]